MKNTSIPSSVYPLNYDNIDIEIHNHIESIQDIWSQYESDDLMFSVAFLKAIEKYPPHEMDFRYGVLYQNQTIIGVSYFQIRLITLGNSLRANKGYNSIFNRVKNWVASKMKSYTLISGNALVTGDYGIRLDAKFDHQNIYNIQKAATDIVSTNYHPNRKVRASFMKDFYQDKKPPMAKSKATSFSQFTVQPNMTLRIRKDWTDFDKYLGSMKSKYRVRSKRAIKKLGSLQKKELSTEDIEKYNDRIYELYLSIANQAGFNLFYLHKEYFLGMKKQFSELFKIYAYFDDQELIAFFTTFDNKSHLEAHFLGYDLNRNAKHQLYLNMLYDLVYVSIKNKHEVIHLSRTALEIKSSIGATPTDMFVYLKHYNPILNYLVPKGLEIFVPKEEWLQRTPFKD